MSTSTAPDASSEAADDGVSPLIEERALLKEWLARLDDNAADAPAHVVDRVRSDYAERLQSVLLDLRPHVEQLRAELDGMRDSLQAAEKRYLEAADELAETRLRHVVGEIEDDEWQDRSPALNAAVEEAEADRSRLTDDVERLRSLVSEIGDPMAMAAPAEPENFGFGDLLDDDPTDAPVAATATEAPQRSFSGADFLDDLESESAPVSASADDVDEDNLPWIELLDPDASDADDETDELDELDFLNWVSSEKVAGAAPPAQAAEEEDDEFAFLQELDRAIAAAPPAARPREVAPSAAATSGVLGCKHCGVTSDSRAWYCEGCGEELT